jgi:hypothetical protein
MAMLFFYLEIVFQGAVMLKELIGVCEICHYRAHVLALSEKEAIERSEQVHENMKGKHCMGKGYIVAALRANKLQQTKAVA